MVPPSGCGIKSEWRNAQRGLERRRERRFGGAGATRPNAAERLSTARGSMAARRASGDAVTSRAASPSLRTFVAAASQASPAREPDVASPTRAIPRPADDAA